MLPGISIVIPSWNGLDLLRRNLPSVIAAAERYRQQSGAAAEIIVVDDGSSDDTPAKMKTEFPAVHLVAQARNRGFAPACNLGIQQAGQPLVALLNNDVRVERDYFLHQTPHFADSQVFAVTARVFEEDPPIFATGGKVGRFRRGFWSVYFNYDVTREWEPQEQLLSAYAVGGFATYDRLKLQSLGGFCELLSPFHWEDIDLSYRGWKRGWKVLYEPRSRAHHQISATINRHFRPRHVEMVARRNRLLFHWINLSSPTFVARHLLMLALLLLTRFLVLDWTFYQAFGQALRRWPQARSLRKHEQAQVKQTDAQLAHDLKDFLRQAPVRVYYNRQEVIEEGPEA